MKKITLLTTAALLSITFLGSQKMTVDAAAPGSRQISTYGNRIIISNIPSKLPGVQGGVGIIGNDCDKDIQSILQDILQNYCPPTGKPDTNLPGKPDNNVPDQNLPDIEIPDTNTPDNNNPETPDHNRPDSKPEAPDHNRPDNKPETPDHNRPDSKPEAPDNNRPDSKPETPDNNTPETENQSYLNQVLKLVNAERAKAGLAALTVDKNAQAAAQVRALEIETSFSHTRPNGSSFSTALKEQNVSYRTAGENIAWGQRSPEAVMEAWMNSAGHRANIMNANYTKIGIGYHQNARGVNYWSQLFIG